VRNSRGAQRPAYANTVSTAALVLALAGLIGGGVAYAAENAPSAKAGKPKIGSAQIKKNAVNRAKIAPNAVDGRRVANGTLRSVDIADGALSGIDLADGSIALQDLAPGLIGSVGIPDGSITGAKLARGAVAGVSIADGGVGQAALAADAVRSANVADGSLRGVDVADSSLTGADIDESSLSEVPFAAEADTLRDGQMQAASVLSNGTLVNSRSFGMALNGVEKPFGAGNYIVKFKADLDRNCVISATISSTEGVTSSAAALPFGFISAVPFTLGGAKNSLLIQTRNGLGDLADLPFSVSVLCR
jgi:hypothetical protein